MSTLAACAAVSAACLALPTVATGVGLAPDRSGMERDGLFARVFPTTGPAGAEPGASASAPRLARLIGQKLVVRMAGQSPSSTLIERIQRGEVGGVALFSDNVSSPSQLQSAIQTLQGAARSGGNPPLVIAVDQEGGQVKRIDGAPTLTPAQMGQEGAATATDQGRQTGMLLASLGINVDFAPVADVPSSDDAFVAKEGRSFGSDANQVAEAAVAFASGLQGEHVAATAKHFPGVGGLTTNTDNAPAVVSQDHYQLEQGLDPFRRVASGQVGLVMASTASYPAYDPSGTPAALSQPILQGLLRETLGFRGPIITDDLEKPTGGSPSEAAVAATSAGADLLLFASTESASADAYSQLLDAAISGRLDQNELTDSYERIQLLKQGLR